MIEDREKEVLFQTQSNIETFKLEVLDIACVAILKLSLMALINLSYMAEFFFTKLSSLTLRKRTFSYASRFLKNLSKEVLMPNNGLHNYTTCFEIRVPPYTANMKIYDVFFILLV